MVHRVQLLVRFRLAILFWCGLFVIPACVYTETESNYRNHKAVNKSDTALQTQGGYLLYGGKRLNAWVLDINTKGDTLYKCYYKEGKAEGWEKVWYANGQLSELRYYKGGKKEGEHKGWFSNGNPRFIFNYENDIYEGNVKEWLQSGQLYKDFNYKKGREVGRQRLWYADGRIRANYDVRNGRKYGLTGVKNCTNITNEESED